MNSSNCVSQIKRNAANGEHVRSFRSPAATCTEASFTGDSGGGGGEASCLKLFSKLSNSSSPRIVCSTSGSSNSMPLAWSIASTSASICSTSTLLRGSAGGCCHCCGASGLQRSSGGWATSDGGRSATESGEPLAGIGREETLSIHSAQHDGEQNSKLSLPIFAHTRSSPPLSPPHTSQTELSSHYVQNVVRLVRSGLTIRSCLQLSYTQFRRWRAIFL